MGNRASPAKFREFTASFLPHRVDIHEHFTDLFLSVPAVAMTTAATAAPTATPTDMAVVMEAATVVTAVAATAVEVLLVVTACLPSARA